MFAPHQALNERASLSMDSLEILPPIKSRTGEPRHLGLPFTCAFTLVVPVKSDNHDDIP